jgi:hypothetical protein
MSFDKRRSIWWSFAAVAVLIVLYPRNTTITSEYKVTVVNRAGQALANVDVHRLVLDFSSGTDSDTSMDALTDAGGTARFPRRQRRISLAGELFGCTRQISVAAAHASCGAYSDISVNNRYLIEIGRLDQRVDGSHRNLRLTMGDCPSGDYWRCKGLGVQ